MKTRHLIALFLLAIFMIFQQWHDVWSWKPVPSLELLYDYSSGFHFRTDENEKFDKNMYSWYSYFKPDDFNTPELQEIYDYYDRTAGFDFENYTYIVSFGFTIEQLLYKGDYDMRKLHSGRVTHGVDCNPDSMLLYRIPKTYLEPNPDRTSSYAYRFIK